MQGKYQMAKAIQILGFRIFMITKLIFRNKYKIQIYQRPKIKYHNLVIQNLYSNKQWLNIKTRPIQLRVTVNKSSKKLQANNQLISFKQKETKKILSKEGLRIS